MKEISIKGIMKAKEMLDNQEAPEPHYVMIYTSIHPIPCNNKWLMWLFINEALYA